MQPSPLTTRLRGGPLWLQRGGHASSPMHAPPCPSWQSHYLRTTCSDTLMLRQRKASAAQLSRSSFTGAELLRPCLGGLATLRLPGEGEAPSPTAQPQGQEASGGGGKVTGHRVRMERPRRDKAMPEASEREEKKNKTDIS